MLSSHLIGCLLIATWVSGEPAWIGKQYNASLSMLLDNIFDNGTVIASPSKKDPDYYVPLGDLSTDFSTM
jgi:hypothetical protein